MTIILFLFLIIIVVLLIYKRSLKGIIIFLIILSVFIGYFLYSLGIEDYYGRNNHIFFDGKKDDIIIMIGRDSKEIIAKGKIQRKSWDRVFIQSENDTLDLNDWIEQKAGYMVEVNCELK